MVCFALGMAAFTTYKTAIPHIVPFYADIVFADLDVWLHGVDPGVALHRLLPSWVSLPIAFAYGPVWMCLWTGLLIFIALQPDADLRRQYLWSMAVAMALLGTLLATALSSVGPIFFDHFYPGERFTELTARLASTMAGQANQGTAAYLLAAFEGGEDILGTGISAMPSMHLALATLHALLLGRLKPVLGALGWAYVALIELGSVYLGWHYAVDGYLSIAAVCLIWYLVDRLGRNVRRVVL